MERRFYIKLTYYKRSGKFYGEGHGWFVVKDLSRPDKDCVMSPPVCDMVELIEQIRKLPVLPGLVSKWDGYIVIEESDAASALIILE